MPAVAPNPYFKPVIIIQSYHAVVLADNPQNYWRLGESTNPLVDSINGNDGTSSGTVTFLTDSLLGSDQINKAIRVTSTAHVNVTSVASLEVSGAKTFEFWMKGDSYNIRSAMLGKQVQSGNFEGWNIRTSQAGSDRRLYINIRETGASELAVKGSTVFSDFAQYHIVITYDGLKSASGIRMFVNGVEETHSIIFDTLVNHPSSSATMMIGAAGGTGALEFTGTLDEVAIYDRVLTPSQILNHYNTGS